MLGAFELIYLISTVLQMYAIYRFMKTFYGSEVCHVSYEWAGYVIYYLSITSVFLTFKTPVLTILVNLVMLLSLSWRYGHNIKKAVTSTLFIYVIMLLVEATLGFAMVRELKLGSLTDVTEYTNIFGTVVINIANYAVVIAISKYMSVRQGNNIPLWYWLLLMVIPISTIYMVLIVYQSSLFVKAQIITFSALLLMINFVVFYLYDVMSHYFEVRIKETSLIQLNKSYTRQFEMMEKSNASNRAFRHDYQKHVNTLRTLLEEGSCSQAATYISDLTRDIDQEGLIARTGNIVIDSIINYELDGVEESGVEVEFRHNYLPNILAVEDYDMTIVLSNLLSNAVESVQTTRDKKRISLQIKFSKGIVYVKVENSFDGVVIQEKGLPTTRKGHKEGHGIGLSNVTQTLDKYDGYLRIIHDETLFTTEAVMYVKSANEAVRTTSTTR